MEDLKRYLETMVVPTVDDFARHPVSVRHGFIACVVTFHAVDYRAYPKSSRSFREKWRDQSPDFALVDKVAHAFKHVKSGHPRRPLRAEHVSSRPPAIPGVMVPGMSVVGDPVGAVLVEGQNLLQVVKGCLVFLRRQH